MASRRIDVGVKLVAFAVAAGLVVWLIAANSGPQGSDPVSVTPEREACEDRLMDQGEFDLSECAPKGNWAQEHPELTGVIAGLSAFLLGAVFVQVQSTGRRS
jgi:hypothetical protein